MNWLFSDRRTRRSDERSVALRYQLEKAKSEGRLEAIVIADDDGLVLAGAGDPSVCQELGAIAPLMIRAAFGVRLPPLLRGGDVGIRTLALEGEPLHLAAVGGGMARDALLTSSVASVRRILASN